MPAHSSTTPAYLSFKEWFSQHLVEPPNNSETLGWTNIDIYLSEIVATNEVVSGPLNTEHFLVLILDGTTRLQARQNGKAYDGYLTPGSMLLSPAVSKNDGRWSHSVNGIFVRLSPQLVDLAAGDLIRGDPARVELFPAFNFHDPLLRSLIAELCSELQNPTPYSELFAESAARMIMLQLLRKSSNAKFTTTLKSCRLTARQMQVIRDYIDSNLDSKITLSDLAALLFMSIPHFERMFRAAFNCAPYRYVLQRRIERAKWLLAHSGVSLHEVACQTGFANQSHFTRHFSKFTGCSPARYREGLKN